MYEKVGEIFTPEQLQFNAKYIIPIDLGTGAHTVYNEDALTKALLKVAEHDENLMGLYQGHIHSHNKMGVFFSGEDTATLIDGAKDSYVFLSLIVNNSSEYLAKYSYKTKNTTTKKVLDRQNQEIVLETTVEEVVSSFDVNIQYAVEYDKFFMTMMEDIERNKIAVQYTMPSHYNFVHSFDNKRVFTGDKIREVKKPKTLKELENKNIFISFNAEDRQKLTTFFAFASDWYPSCLKSLVILQDSLCIYQLNNAQKYIKENILSANLEALSKDCIEEQDFLATCSELYEATVTIREYFKLIKLNNMSKAPSEESKTVLKNSLFAIETFVAPYVHSSIVEQTELF